MIHQPLLRRSSDYLFVDGYNSAPPKSQIHNNEWPPWEYVVEKKLSYWSGYSWTINTARSIIKTIDWSSSLVRPFPRLFVVPKKNTHLLLHLLLIPDHYSDPLNRFFVFRKCHSFNFIHLWTFCQTINRPLKLRKNSSRRSFVNDCGYEIPSSSPIGFGKCKFEYLSIPGKEKKRERSSNPHHLLTKRQSAVVL